MAAVAAGALFAGIIIYHDLAHNHEVYVSKARRSAQVVDVEDAAVFKRDEPRQGWVRPPDPTVGAETRAEGVWGWETRRYVRARLWDEG